MTIQATRISMNSRPAVRGLAIVAYLVFLFLISVFAYRRPHYNWDMLAYMALVVRMDKGKIDAMDIHRTTYASAQKNIPATEFSYLLGSSRRLLLSQNPEAFYDQLGFYAVKPMYTGMVYLFYKAGFSLPRATVLPSIVSYLFIGLLLLYWLLKYLQFIFAVIAALLIMYSDMMVSIARASTPDCLSGLLLLLFLYFIIEKPSLKWLGFFLVLSVFARLDNVLPGFFILSFLFISKKWPGHISMGKYLLLLLILGVSYFIITFSASGFGMEMMYYPEFASHLGVTHEYSADSFAERYMALVVSALITGIVHYHFMFFMLLLLLLLYTPSFRFNRLGFDQLLGIAFIVVMMARFLLFPDLADRFFIAYYLCILLLLIRRYAGAISISENNRKAT